MKLLLDTCVVLWLMMESTKISPVLRDILANPANTRYLSAVSVWEVVVKWKANKLKLPKPPAEFFAEIKARGKMRPLPIDDFSIMQLPKLPTPHNDPFDRMLICQAIENGMTVVTPDELILQYPIKTLWM
jgi:PIN domain nuclease of toxin-antitoxin system